jgi:pimeloyl-ACP methyl ester carboxylesterase
MSGARRGFVAVGDRRVHYRRMGSGPPLVMLHGSPGDSEMLGAEMAAAAGRYTCIALDTPGFGFSDALPGEVLTVPELAAATAAAMSALGLPPCAVYGSHTGAAIALELGVGWPQQVTGLVLEGLPIFTETEIADLFQDYFAPMVPDPLGGHLFSTWMRFRDQFTWFPWTSRNVARLNPVDRPGADDIHHWVSMYYRGCKTYRPAYRAACHYGAAAHHAVEALRVPAVFMASAEDMLFPHLDRLPALRAGQHIERLPHDHGAKMRSIAGFVDSLPRGSPGSFTFPRTPVGSGPALQFMDTDSGQVLVRHYGQRERPALVLLHDAPGSGLAHDDLARSLGDHVHVVLPDLPGNGQSTAPAEGCSVIDAAVDAVLAIVEQAGIDAFAVVGIGCGAMVAARLTERADPRLTAVVVEHPPVADEDAAQRIAPDLQMSPEGAHWLQAWMQLRDAQIYSPWFDGRVKAQRRTQGCFDAQWLHDQTCALMASRTSYHRLPQEAWRFDARAAWADARVPAHTAPEGDLTGFIRSTLLAPALTHTGHTA